MCMPKAPKVETPAPPPTIEQARTDDASARQDERKRLRGAMNSRTTILSEGSSGTGSGRKTLLGQ